MNSLDLNLYNKIFFASQIREIDKYTMDNEPIESIDLMERAARAIFNCITSVYGKHIVFKVFAGAGNNGGDAIALARMLHLSGYKVELFMVKISDNLSDDAEINLKRYEALDCAVIKHISDIAHFPALKFGDIIIEGLFGTGLSRPIKGLCAEVIKAINNSHAEVVAIDVPSGLMPEDNTNNDPENIIKARYTLSLEFPKLSFLFPENEKYVGKMLVLPIGLHPEIIRQKSSHYNILLRKDIQKKVNELPTFTHKGNMGHALLVSGSYGKMGAALLASKACLRTGIGLLTVHIPQKGYDIMQTAVPEAMVEIDKSGEIFTEPNDISKYKAIAIGPGLGTNDDSYKAMKTLLENYSQPMVLDADALNIISEHNDLFQLIPKNSIITPHPGEFTRLVGKWDNSNQKLEKQKALAKKYSIIVVVKGAFTTIVTPEGKCYFNTTGNPGMATAGSGDVLTGIVLAMLSQGYKPEDAACLGVYLHGLSGDIAASHMGERSLIAGDIVDFMGASWKKLLKIS